MWVERLITEAIERGELDPQKGVGEPIQDLDDDPDWWVKKRVKRENLEGLAARGRVPRWEGPRDPGDQ